MFDTAFAGYAECPEKQKSGAPCYVENPATDDQMVFYVARNGNKESSIQIKELSEQLFGAFPNPKDYDDNLVKAHWLGEYGLKGWENVPDGEGGYIKFTRQNAIQAMTDPDIRQSLVQVLWVFSVNYENYLKEKAFEDLDELKKP